MIAVCPNCGSPKFTHYYERKKILEVSEIMSWNGDDDMPKYGKVWNEEDEGNGSFYYECDECDSAFESPEWREA